MQKDEIKEVGERYCLGQLKLIGKNASRAEDKNQKGWDIKISESPKEIKVQVKTLIWESNGTFSRDEKSIPVIKGHFIKNNFDYLVIIFLNLNKIDFTSYVIPYNRLKEKGATDKQKLIDEDGYIYYSTRVTEIEIDNKQSISISTIKHEEVQKLFEIYLNKFCIII
jgi:hypothetical protein